MRIFIFLACRGRGRRSIPGFPRRHLLRLSVSVPTIFSFGNSLLVLYWCIIGL